MDPSPTPSFPWFAPAVALGLSEPTAVQKAVWDPFSARRDLIVQSGTGTGKTLAYLLPLFAGLDPNRKDCQGLVLVPTQELAVQIQRQMERLAAGTPVRALVLMGGVNLARQVDLLKTKPHVVVGTPGRVLELLEKKKITGHFLGSVVLDEGDRLLVPETLPTVRAILKTTLKSRQTTVFSASIPGSSETLAREFLRDPLVLRLDAQTPVPESIVHWGFRAELRDKADLLRKVLHSLNPPRTLVFLNKPEQIERLADKLRHHGVAAESLHGSRFKADRQRALEGFVQGAVTVLVASDLAARGLHIEGVSHVVHFDVPDDPLDYQHRCGRTGRAGRPGWSLAFADEVEWVRLASVEKALGIRVQPKVVHHGVVSDGR